MSRTSSPRRRPERQSAPGRAADTTTRTGFVLDIPPTGDVVLHFARPDPAEGAQVTALCGKVGKASYDYGPRRKALCRDGCL